MEERFENIAAGRSSNVLYFVKTAAAHIQVVTSILVQLCFLLAGGFLANSAIPQSVCSLL